MNTKNAIIRELNRSTRQFIEYMEEYTDCEIDSPLSKDKWDMVQLIEHVILTDKSVIDLLPHTFHKMKSGHYSKYKIRPNN